MWLWSNHVILYLSYIVTWLNRGLEIRIIIIYLQNLDDILREG